MIDWYEAMVKEFERRMAIAIDRWRERGQARLEDVGNAFRRWIETAIARMPYEGWRDELNNLVSDCAALDVEIRPGGIARLAEVLERVSMQQASNQQAANVVNSTKPREPLPAIDYFHSRPLEAQVGLAIALVDADTKAEEENSFPPPLVATGASSNPVVREVLGLLDADNGSTYQGPELQRILTLQNGNGDFWYAYRLTLWPKFGLSGTIIFEPTPPTDGHDCNKVRLAQVARFVSVDVQPPKEAWRKRTKAGFFVDSRQGVKSIYYRDSFEWKSRSQDGSRTMRSQSFASLYDWPGWEYALRQELETVAYCVDDQQPLGAIRWGYEANKDEKEKMVVRFIEPTVHDAPSAEFLAAVELFQH